jgi:hypothetical protein
VKRNFRHAQGAGVRGYVVAASLSTLESSDVRKLIDRQGPDRVIFASDWLMTDPPTERAFIEGLGFADDDVVGMLGGAWCPRCLKKVPEDTNRWPNLRTLDSKR